MAVLTTKNYATLINDFSSAVQGSASALLNFVVGSILRAIGQAVASVAMWLQGIILQLLTVTRLASSSGTDVDSFLADFKLTRIPAVQAIGPVTFSRATPTIATAIPVGAVVVSGDGSQSFVVIADANNPAYSAGFNSYPLAVGISSINATVQAVNGGTGGNVSAGGISILQTGIPGVDTVSNPSSFTTGINQETDAAAKVRFQNYLSSLFNASEQALTFAIDAVNQNIQVQIVEQPLGFPNVLLYVDDGSGSISAALVSAASVAANRVRAAGISIGVVAATAVLATVSCNIVTAPGYVHNTVVGQVANNITAYINGIGLADTPADGALDYFGLSTVAKNTAGVLRVENLLLNGNSLDLVPGVGQTVKAGTVSVS